MLFPADALPAFSTMSVWIPLQVIEFPAAIVSVACASWRPPGASTPGPCLSGAFAGAVALGLPDSGAEGQAVVLYRCGGRAQPKECVRCARVIC